MKHFTKKIYKNRKHSHKTKNKKKKTKSKRTKHVYRHKKMKGGVYWNEKLPKEEQVLSNRILTGRKLKTSIVQDCVENKNGKVVNVKYNLDSIPYDSDLSPIKIFRNGSNFTDLENGIHNFILFWDDINNQYVLTTSFFTALEFASKHFMLSKRLGNNVPEHFIIAGEIKKNDNAVKFHDTSSFYIESVPNFKTGFLVYFLYKFKNENEDLLASNFPEFKERFMESIKTIPNINKSIPYINIFRPFYHKFQSTKNIDEMYKVLTFKGTDFTNSYGGEIYEYIQLIQIIMNDAFKTIFNDQTIEIIYQAKFKGEYGNQNEQDKFYTDMCNKNPSYSFDYYTDLNTCEQENEAGKIGNTCDDYRRV